jgi:hypothetical protein
MKKKIMVIFVLSLFVIVNFPTTGEKILADLVINYEICPVMKVDSITIEKWKNDLNTAEEAYINPNLVEEIQATTSFSILHYLDYVPSERDQGWCSNCWAWPATAIMGIALYVQEGVFERLSVQYINSCGTVVGSDCCEGGNLNIFTRFYRNTDKAIPWSNENAHWQDGRAQCRTDCEDISTEPNFPINFISARTIETHEIPEEEVIANVKNILHQEKGVYFSWFLPDMDYREHFSDFWSNRDEEHIYDLDWDCGGEFLEEEGGGHAVLCVGYNDDEGENNDYWIMLNSWGTPSRRPNGLFAVNMHMDYDCTIMYQDHEYYSFDFQTIDIEYGSGEESPEPPLIQGPTTGNASIEQSYQISAVDNQGDDVYFSIDWDDGLTEEWLGPVNSGEEMEVSHTWTRRGIYTIRVKAKDTNDAESFTTTLEVAMPKYKMFKTSLINFLQGYNPLIRFIKRFI